MKLKKHSVIPWLLMLPSLILLWLVRDMIVECIAARKFSTLFGLLGMTVGMYWMVAYVGVWCWLICEGGRKKAAKRLKEEGFHYQYSLSDTGLSYAFWINEKEGRVALWNRSEPFALHRTEAGRITGVAVEEKGNEAVLGKLTVRMNVNGNPISLILMQRSDHMVLRTSERASLALARAKGLCASLKRAGAEVL